MLCRRFFWIAWGSALVWAQQGVPVSGVVQDATTGEPIAGATVYVLERSSGAVSSLRGTFRLVLSPGWYTLRVRSLGYEEALFSVRIPTDTLHIRLRPLPIELGAVRVEVELSPEEIVRNAMERRRQNWERLRTLQGMLYSKLVFGLHGSGTAVVALGGGEIELGHDTAFAILESFAAFFYDAERGWRAELLQRRQTRNIPPQANQLVLGSLQSLYQDELQLLGVRIPSPLGPQALERYRFRLVERRPWGERTDPSTSGAVTHVLEVREDGTLVCHEGGVRQRLAYVLEVEPRSRLFPAFQGTIVIADSSFALMEATLRLSESTALPFVEELEFQQQYERLPGEIWYPLTATMHGRYRLRALQGLAEFGGEFHLMRALTEVRVNEPLPDTVFRAEERVRVAPFADSARTEFWQRYALAELSPREQAIYRRMDSLAQSVPESRRGLSLPGILPQVGFSRVDGLRLGIGVMPTLFGVALRAGALYATAPARWYGWLGAELRLPSLKLQTELLSLPEPMGQDRDYPELLNSLTALLLHRDYYDWLRRTGWRAALELRPLQDAIMQLGMERTWQEALSVTAGRSLFSRAPWRDNPKASEGNFRLLWLQLRLLQAAREGLRFELGHHGIRLGAVVTVMLGITPERWSTQHVLFHAHVPTFSTGGYEPMSARLWVELGWGQSAVPVQYSFRMRTGHAGLDAPGHVLSAPSGLYGGRRLVALVCEHNFGDLWWRALGLPTVRRRGLELFVGAAAVQTFQSAGTPYRETGRGWYSELTAGLGRIPVVVTDFLSLRARVSYGIGSIARGRWAGGIQLVFGP